MKNISIVVPIYNEEGNIRELHAEIVDACNKLECKSEIIFIDDGSIDRTVEIAKTLSPLKLICLRKNFGQTAAMDAGIKTASNDYIVTMDGDRQNDPADIQNLINKLESENLDVVSGWRKNRKDSLSKHLASRCANLLRGFLINDGIQDSGCSLKIYKRECFSSLTLYGEMHRFIPALLRIKGYRIGEVEVNHRPRTAGKTKYNWRRGIKGGIDMLSVCFWNRYAMRPLHLLGTMGLALLTLGGISGLITFYQFLIGQNMSNTAWPLLTVFLVMMGIQIFISGLIADILAKNYFETTNDVHYSIKEIINV